LYPDADFDRMLTMMKNLTIGFFLNDVMGRDNFKFLPEMQQVSARKMIQNMARLDDTLKISPEAALIEIANAEVLKDFKEQSPGIWFKRFLSIYCHHINITHTDNDSAAKGRIPLVDEYIERRCHLGGVHHIVMWIEYAEGQFLDWNFLKVNNISLQLKRLHWVVAAFAGLSNDLFSFEKECIDCRADSNLVMVIALNRPELSLKEVILRSSEIVRNLLLELVVTLENIKHEIENMVETVPTMAGKLYAHVEGIVQCVQAIWMWHVYTKRYKRPNSIWKETELLS
ncbi:terpene synthase family protein, partial [Flavitalea flava]